MKDACWDRKSGEVQIYADTHNSKKFFSALKAVCRPSKAESTPLQSADRSMLIKDQEGLRNRWAEHFSTLLNRPSTVDPTALEQVPQQTTLNDLDLTPSMDELTKAIQQTNYGRAPGKDGIPAEIYKATGPRAMEVFLDIIQSIWDQEKTPEDFRDALIVALYKNKGSKPDCGNYRGISLLSIAGKIFARVVLNRLMAVSEANLPDAQCGFHPGRSTVDMIFTVKQVQEKCLEQSLDLYCVFIDLTKAFDTVKGQALWDVLACYGCPPNFIQIIRFFHVDMTGQVLSNGEQVDTFSISNGVKKGLCPRSSSVQFFLHLRPGASSREHG